MNHHQYSSPVKKAMRYLERMMKEAEDGIKYAYDDRRNDAFLAYRTIRAAFDLIQGSDAWKKPGLW